jgi:hypothetical protein
MILIKFSKSNNIKFYAAYIFLCILIPILLLEFGLRFATFPSGTGAGSASQRWFEKNWNPINAEGYRDLELNDNSEKPAMVFLGDSFTAGHGVKFTETYYFWARKNFSNSYDFVNLGRNGASTKHQEKNLVKFFAAHTVQPRYMIHQYFGNDIEDYIERIKIERGFLRRNLSRVSELYNFIDTYFYIAEFSKLYIEQLLGAYENQHLFKQHYSDIERIHETVYSKNGQIIFVLFPFLNSEQALNASGTYIKRVKDAFLQGCRQGDIFIDVTPLAFSLTSSERVVNFMDGHPSPRLHRMVGEQLSEIFSYASNLTTRDGVTYCTK